MGVISDIHVRLDYDPAVGTDRYCLRQDEEEPAVALRAYRYLTSLLQSGTDGGEALEAPLGRLMCDIPKELLGYMLQTFVELNSEDEAVDYILLNGDLIGHHVSQRAHHSYHP